MCFVFQKKYEVALENDYGSWRNFIDKMRKDGEWGTEIAIEVAASALGIRIFVQAYDEDSDSIKEYIFQPKRPTRPVANVFLGNIVQLHFVALDSKGILCQLQYINMQYFHMCV